MLRINDFRRFTCIIAQVEDLRKTCQLVDPQLERTNVVDPKDWTGSESHSPCPARSILVDVTAAAGMGEKPICGRGVGVVLAGLGGLSRRRVVLGGLGRCLTEVNILWNTICRWLRAGRGGVWTRAEQAIQAAVI